MSDSLKKKQNIKRRICNNAKQYVSDILKTCDNYEREVKEFDK